MSGARRETTAISRSAHGIAAVRRICRVSNEIAVNVIDVDVDPEPAWADYSVPTHASLSIHLENSGGRAELRLKRDQPSSDGSHAICFTPAGAPIWGFTQGAMRASGIKLDFDLPRVSQAFGHKLITPDQPRSFRNDRLRRLAECLADECRKPEALSRLYLDALTVAVCIDFLRLSAEPSSRRAGRLAPSQVRRTTDYLMDHLPESVRLSALADLTGLSQWHFARAFKAATGLSPHQWQLNARIAKAQELLLARSMPHAQIALEVGFAEQSHLCRVFKKVIGVSPAAWLRDHRAPRR